MNKSYPNKNDVSSSGYEDSEVETIASNEESHQNSGRLQTFLASKGYKGVKALNKICSPQIDSDEEEVYLLRITKSIDPKVLENTKFSLNKASKVKTESGIYYMKPLADVTEPKFFMHSNGLKKINPVSMLQLEKFVETQDESKDAIEENEIQPAPNDLIPRHTMFGTKYKERINLQKEIKKKLQEALQRFDEKTEPVSKKKKKKTINSDDYDDKSLLISQILETKFKDKKSGEREIKNKHEKSKKKRDSDKIKTENVVLPNITQDCEDNVVSRSPGKSKKKIKEYGSISIEIKKEILSESEMPELSAKEKKKRKRDSGAGLIAPEMIKQEIDDSFLPPIKKRKPSILSSTVIKEGSPDFQFDVSVIDSKTDKKKKKPKKSNTSDLMDDIKPDVSSLVIEEKTQKKKKKKKHADNSAHSTLDSLS